jgi:Arylsulfatase A and related enzymes
MYGGYEQLSEERTLISEIFDDAGYRTGGFHSNAYLNAEFGYDRGWSRLFDSMTNPGLTAEFRQWVKNNLNDEGTIYKLLSSAFDTAERQAGVSIGSAYVDADEITNYAIEWLESGNSQHTFLWIHYMDVHHPYVPPKEHQLEFRDEYISEHRAVQLRRKFIENPESVTDKELNDIIDLYDAEIRFTDAEIGRLLDAADETLNEYAVMVTADHGEEFRDHDEFSHSAKFYDEVLHVPMVFSDTKHEGHYDELVGLLDIAPTLVDTMGLDLPENFHGYSIQTLFSGNEWPRSEILCDWAGEQGGSRRFAYRDHDWKYIRRQGHEELYDLQTDSSERRNILLTDREPAVLDEVREAVREHELEIEETTVDVEQVEMDKKVRQQLQDLGYKE